MKKQRQIETPNLQIPRETETRKSGMPERISRTQKMPLPLFQASLHMLERVDDDQTPRGAEKNRRDGILDAAQAVYDAVAGTGARNQPETVNAATDITTDVANPDYRGSAMIEYIQIVGTLNDDGTVNIKGTAQTTYEGIVGQGNKSSDIVGNENYQGSSETTYLAAIAVPFQQRWGTPSHWGFRL